MSQLKQCKFQPHHFAQSLGTDVPVIEHQVAQGVAECWEMNGCHFITRIERDAVIDHTEICVVAAEGRNLAAGCHEIINAARLRGIQSIRYHTNRAGLPRALARAGINMRPVETVYRMEL